MLALVVVSRVVALLLRALVDSELNALPVDAADAHAVEPRHAQVARQLLSFSSGQVCEVDIAHDEAQRPVGLTLHPRIDRAPERDVALAPVAGQGFADLRQQVAALACKQ